MRKNTAKHWRGVSEGGVIKLSDKAEPVGLIFYAVGWTVVVLGGGGVLVVVVSTRLGGSGGEARKLAS